MFTTFLLVVIALAFIFDFINGFHDAANSIATVVSTKVLSPLAAVIWAAFFNLIAYFVFPLKVADAVAKTVDASTITLTVVCAGLIAAICWNLLTWWFGIPSSSSHTLIGGFAGAGIAHAGFNVVKYSNIMPTVYFIVLAPFIGMFISYIISIITIHICKRGNPHRIDRTFRRLQLLSSAAFSLGHGGSDAQKVMGIIGAALMAEKVIPGMEQLPVWVPLSCHASIALGTLFGGWRIVKTMGQKITKLTPFEGFSAETAGALTLFGTAHLGIPVSTTHTISGSIMGVGITKRISAVRWGVSINLIWAWVLTIPVSAALAAGFYYILSPMLT